MATCGECGASVPDGNKFCNVCGKPMSAPQAAPQAVYAPPQPQYQAPSYQAPPAHAGYQDLSDTLPPEGSRYAVMSTGSFFWSAFIIGIPFIGWLACLIWACGGTRYQNKRNFCRAILIFCLIGFLVSLVMYFAVRWIVGAAVGAAVQGAGDTGGGLVALKELLEMLLGYVNGLIAAQGQ